MFGGEVQSGDIIRVGQVSGFWERRQWDLPRLPHDDPREVLAHSGIGPIHPIIRLLLLVSVVAMVIIVLRTRKLWK